MALYTKSIRAPPLKGDGLRVCVMRRPYKDGEAYGHFDLWIPDLAPSDQLLTKRVHCGIDWEPFAEEYQRELDERFAIPGKPNSIHELTKWALGQDVTILCFEKTPEECHRSILTKLCEDYAKSIDETLETHIR